VTDVWACGQCRSINKRADSRCYSCKTPRLAAEVDPLQMQVTGAAAGATPTGQYQSTSGLAVLLSLLIVGAAAVNVAGNVWGLGLVDSMRAGGTPTAADGEVLGTVVLATIGIVLLAMAVWAVWLSRVVANLPALRLGYGRVSPRFVLVEGLIPVYNLYRMPGIVSDIFRRIDPVPRDGVLIAAAWLPLVGAILVPLFILRASPFIESGALLQIAEIGREISVGFQLVAALFLVALVWRVEGRVRRRARRLGAMSGA
jgi:hypothetical protein